MDLIKVNALETRPLGFSAEILVRPFPRPEPMNKVRNLLQSWD